MVVGGGDGAVWPAASFRPPDFAAPFAAAANRGEARGGGRGALDHGRIYLGLGLCCILLAQPLLYMALGFSWAFTAFGRMISMLSDGGNKLYNWLWLVVALALAALPLAFAFGLVA